MHYHINRNFQNSVSALSFDMYLEFQLLLNIFTAFPLFSFCAISSEIVIIVMVFRYSVWSLWTSMVRWFSHTSTKLATRPLCVRYVFAMKLCRPLCYVPASLHSRTLDNSSSVYDYIYRRFNINARQIEEFEIRFFVCVLKLTMYLCVQHLKLCPTDLKQSPLLGGEKCTYGPSYWCISMKTASECHVSLFRRLMSNLLLTFLY